MTKRGYWAGLTRAFPLGSAVIVLSSDDPVRVFQRYSTLDAVSDGRAEVILGRGSSIDSFPLFGYDLADYEDLERDDLLAVLAFAARLARTRRLQPVGP